jgi:selenocysteine-specific elongation factor
MPREEFKSRLRLTNYGNQVLDRAVTQGLLTIEYALLRRPGWSPRLSTSQQKQVEEVMQLFANSGFTPPATSEVESRLPPDILTYLLQTGKLLRVGDNVLFAADVYHSMEQRVIAHLQSHENISAAEVRDLLGTSRKYALALLEDLDSRRITKRLGDVRVLRVRERPTSVPGE